MLHASEASLDHAAEPFAADGSSLRPSPSPRDLGELLRGVPLRRRLVRPKEHVFRAGQLRRSLFLVHAGAYKTCLASSDGREKVTGFSLRGDLLGLDAIGMDTYACDAMALDTGELWELPYAELCRSLPGFERRVSACMAAEIRRDRDWMLTLATLTAEQRVMSFLLDLAQRLGALGFSDRRLLLRMTRAELGSFLSLTLETVTRALSRLQERGLVRVQGREVALCGPLSLEQYLGSDDYPRPRPGAFPPSTACTASSSCSRR